MIKTNPISSKRANDFVIECTELLGYLRDRWLDESQYENMDDYLKKIQDEAGEFEVKVTKMSKRPFGCFFTADGINFQVMVKGNMVTYRRII